MDYFASRWGFTIAIRIVDSYVSISDSHVPTHYFASPWGFTIAIWMLDLGGGLGGALGILFANTKVSAPVSRQIFFLSASLGGPWGLPGRSLEVLGGSLGAPRHPSGHPGATLTIRALTLEGLRDALGGSKTSPRPFF